MPAFMNCSESPEPGCTQNTTVSATPATSVSDWPTPTVSISTRSNRARITTMAASVWSASPPSRSRAAIERTKTPSSALSWTMRTRSPSSAPPLALEDGSTAITPTVLPALRQAATRAAHSEDLPTPGGPVMPTTWAPRLAPRRVEQRLRRRAVGIALQSGERRRQRPLAAPCRLAQRLKRHSVLSGPPSAACAAASRAIGTR